MRKFLFILILLATPLVIGVPAGGRLSHDDGTACMKLYRTLNLAGILDYETFQRACAGYDRIDNRRKNIITLIDFTKPSTEKRLFVIDMDKGKLLFHTHVAHGRNSGGNYATSFSNRNGSHQSSLGFYLTGNTYQGRNGYSMLLYGLEEGFNDKALERAIVVHPAAYANPSVIASGGRLGRSWGCPALPEEVSGEIIDAIRDGSVMYIHANDHTYLAQSGFSTPPKVN